MGQYTSLAFGPDGWPASSYYDVTNTDLKFASFDGSNWQISTVDTTNAGIDSSLVFLPTGHPAIAYVGNGDIKYASFSGTNWSFSTVDTRGGREISLALNRGGDPALSYHMGNRDLVYSFRVGNGWTNITVDPGSSNPDIRVGGFNSLAFGPDGHPAISYRYDLRGSAQTPDERSLRFARFTGGTNWNITTIEGIADPEFISLAFGPDGLPAIAASDRASSDLKFFRRSLFTP